MRAKEVLLEAISGYSGTVVFVSHDRYFIDRLATRVLEIENGAIMAYEGNYEDYLRRKVALAAPLQMDGHRERSSRRSSSRTCSFSGHETARACRNHPPHRGWIRGTQW
jgi:ATPase subunit of ABC transporter with duplicated ATPase domains